MLTMDWMSVSNSRPPFLYTPHSKKQTLEKGTLMSIATPAATHTVKHIDEARLENDLAYRFGYLAEFMEFSAADIATIHAAAAHLAAHVPALVDAVYVKLFQYDATKRHFVPRQFGYNGDVPSSIEELNLEHEQIQFCSNMQHAPV